jgi:hypothetical protein
MNAAKYLLDANVFMESKRYYSFDIAPGFWETIKTEHEKGKLFSLQCVREEILKGKDELKEWIKKLDPKFFLAQDEAIEAYEEIQKWAEEQKERYKESAIAEFARYDADPRLIAFALKNKYKLVTMEKLNLEKKCAIPIPNVCKEFEIECLDTFDMLRELEVSLVRCEK